MASGGLKQKKDSVFTTVRNWLAVHVHNKSNAGAHGGSKRQKNKRDRKKVKKQLKEDY